MKKLLLIFVTLLSISCTDAQIDKKKAFLMLNSGSSFTPISLSPFFWHDAQNGDFVAGADNNGTRARGNLIATSVDETGKTMTVPSTNPIFNGEGWYFKTTAYYTLGSIGDYNFIHNGSDFDIFINYYQPTAASGNIRAILNNNGFSNTARGILLYYDNASGTNSLKLRIGNGTSSVISRDASGAITQNADNKIRINKSGNTVTLYVNGISVATQTNTGWSASNSVAVLSVMSQTAASAITYLKDLVIFDRSLAAGEVTSMNNRTFISVTPTAINTDIIIGDSNAQGLAPNAGIASELTSLINVQINRNSSASVQQGDYIEKLLLTRNQALLNQPLTQHGAEMRLAYSFGSNRAILKYGQGSTDAANWLGATNFNKWLAMIDWYCINQLHAMRQTVTVRSIIVLHGANDCQVGEGGNYKTDMTAIIKGTIERFVSNNATVKARLIFPRTISGGSGFDATAYGLVVAAQTDMGNGSIPTDEPTIATYIKGSYGFSTEGQTTIDTVHWSTSAFDYISGLIYSYLLPYVNE
jgi:hypothetical protein